MTVHSNNTPAATPRHIADTAGKRIAPLWPLKTFVAVNPYFGLSDMPFATAAERLARVTGARSTQSRAVYLDAIAQGTITACDLRAARAGVSHPTLPSEPDALVAKAKSSMSVAPDRLPALTDLAGRDAGSDWTAFVTERVSLFAATVFDEGQAAWRAVAQDESLYQGWRLEAVIDRTPDVAGLTGVRAAIRDLPESVDDLLAQTSDRLGLSDQGLEVYFHRLLMSVGGWAAFARQKVWQSELAGGTDDTLTEFLAIRLAWDLAILEAGDAMLADAWADVVPLYDAPDEPGEALALDCVLQTAFDRAEERRLASAFAQALPRTSADTMTRKAVQAVFCIDVRSEVYRRALERVAPEVETIGFAGFFGFAIEYARFGEKQGAAQCPVLLSPQKLVCEAVEGADDAKVGRILAARGIAARMRAAWSSFKLAAVSSFAFVETLGLAYVTKLIRDGFGWPKRKQTDAGLVFAPRIDADENAGRANGFTLAERIDSAEAVLKAMSLTTGFARVVMLAGHGSTSLNNPHASGLDCGACGGHTGEANARVAAAILNDTKVRVGLAARAIVVPHDTIFVAALHDTTTDKLSIFDRTHVPASHARDLAALEQWAAAAGRLTRAERAARLPIASGVDVDTGVLARAANWAEVRPEWGLAGCSAFIAAPRARTVSLDLGGEAFLHSYDWRRDEGFGTLELIMTAPMVVASWINLQYYGSSVDNEVFGSGNKVLHNVVAGIGVLEGAGGDLRVGLPMQSVHDGETLMHTPRRLKVVIEAPEEAVRDVIARHAMVRDLLDNGWVQVFLLGEDGRIVARYDGDLAFAEMPSQDQAAAHRDVSRAA